MKLIFEVREGKGGRWRAFLIDEEDNRRTLASVGMARGYKEKEQAIKDAESILNYGASQAEGRIKRRPLAEFLWGAILGTLVSLILLNVVVPIAGWMS